MVGEPEALVNVACDDLEGLIVDVTADQFIDRPAPPRFRHEEPDVAPALLRRRSPPGEHRRARPRHL